MTDGLSVPIPLTTGGSYRDKFGQWCDRHKDVDIMTLLRGKPGGRVMLTTLTGKDFEVKVQEVAYDQLLSTDAYWERVLSTARASVGVD